MLDDIETLIGRIAINNLMGYAVAIYQEDMDGKRIGKSYLEITARGVKEAPNEKWIGWNQYIQDNHLNWNLNDLEKEREIRFIIRQCIEEEILQVENGYIMVIRESADGSTVWYPTTYEQVIEDLKMKGNFKYLEMPCIEDKFYLIKLINKWKHPRIHCNRLINRKKSKNQKIENKCFSNP